MDLEEIIAFGNFEGLAVDGAKLMQVLDEQDQAVHRLIKNTGRVFGAINEREGALRDDVLRRIDDALGAAGAGP